MFCNNNLILNFKGYTYRWSTACRKQTMYYTVSIVTYSALQSTKLTQYDYNNFTDLNMIQQFLQLVHGSQSLYSSHTEYCQQSKHCDHHHTRKHYMIQHLYCSQYNVFTREKLTCMHGAARAVLHNYIICNSKLVANLKCNGPAMHFCEEYNCMELKIKISHAHKSNMQTLLPVMSSSGHNAAVLSRGKSEMVSDLLEVSILKASNLK